MMQIYATVVNTHMRILIIIDFLDIIHHPVLLFKNISETVSVLK
jgi:hypothetical protein